MTTKELVTALHGQHRAVPQGFCRNPYKVIHLLDAQDRDWRVYLEGAGRVHASFSHWDGALFVVGYTKNFEDIDVAEIPDWLDRDEILEMLESRMETSQRGLDELMQAKAEREQEERE